MSATVYIVQICSCIRVEILQSNCSARIFSLLLQNNNNFNSPNQVGFYIGMHVKQHYQEVKNSKNSRQHDIFSLSRILNKGLITQSNKFAIILWNVIIWHFSFAQQLLIKNKSGINCFEYTGINEAQLFWQHVVSWAKQKSLLSHIQLYVYPQSVTPREV